MAGTRVPTTSYNDPMASMNLPSSPFPFSSFLSDSIFTLDSNMPAPLPAPLPPQPVPHQAGLFVHSKEINPFERSFAVLDSNSIQDSKPFAGGANRNGNGLNMSNLSLPTPKGKRKRALSSPALFTPGGTGEAIDDGTAQAFKQAKRPSLRLAPGEKGLPAIPGLARGLIDSSSSIALSDSTGSSRSNTSVSFDDDPNFRPKVAPGHISTDSPDSSVGLSPEMSKPPVQLRASSIDASYLSSNSQAAPPNYAHYQPQPIPFSVPSIAPNPTSYSAATRPFSSSAFATTTLAPASIAPPAPVPQANGVALSSFNPSLSYAPQDDSSFPFSDPFALVPQQHPQPAVYSNLAASMPPPHASTSSNIPPPPPPHFAPVPPTSNESASLIFAPQSQPQIQSNHPSQPQLSQSQSSYTSITTTTVKPTGKKRGRKPKNWDPSLEVEVILDPEEAERQRKLALERNRIAASKSRRRKKEKVQALEGAAREYCEGNQLLQSQCQALLAEVHQLRSYLIQAHPQPGCKCQHVHGYFNREREGGGLCAIMFEAQGTLERDFSKVPRWGSEEDLYAGMDQRRHPVGLPRQGGGDVAMNNSTTGVPNGGSKTKGKAATTTTKKGGKKQAEPESDDDDEEDDDDEDLSEEESEEEKVALKSRRARAIPLRKA